MADKVHGLVKDLDGIRFNKLIASNEIKYRFGKNKKTVVRKCKCDCGQEVWIETQRLIDGHTKSCGCFRKEFKKKPNQEAFKNEIFASYKHIAEKRNLEFVLDLNTTTNLILDNCHYCGIEPSNTIKRKRCSDSFKYNGIDRVDNTKGYSIENCVTCCGECNMGKLAKSKEDFLNWITRIYKYSVEAR